MLHPRQSNLAEESCKISVPKNIVDFEVNHIENKSQEWAIELVEKADRVLGALSGKEVVLDGHNNEIDILTHGFFEKKLLAFDMHRFWESLQPVMYPLVNKSTALR